jgi:hypothetical protein
MSFSARSSSAQSPSSAHLSNNACLDFAIHGSLLWVLNLYSLLALIALWLL